MPIWFAIILAAVIVASAIRPAIWPPIWRALGRGAKALLVLVLICLWLRIWEWDRLGERLIGVTVLAVGVACVLAIGKIWEWLVEHKDQRRMPTVLPELFAAPIGPDKRKPKVLVADDERVIADTLTLVLKQHRYDATAVYTGNDEIERAREIQPDFIISDITKPDINGIEAAIRVREFLPQCKVLLFTGNSAWREDVNSAIAEGHEFGFYAKPVPAQDLLAWLKDPQTHKAAIPKG